MMIKGGLVRIHDDYMRSPEESLEIMKRVEEIAYRHLSVKYAKKAMEKSEKDSPT
ncbi:hypothetical protein QA584_17445 [Anaerocolumna sp. AGMB13025]|uniref:hypothetical protein n=1 Tax=Anaerocolumna sp. AGMB13025 TaxID=3039116 RepID=UPI00241FE1A7|nr:hypothetical protein [Anaerocolumna sp. AGMB13025]WFR55386.1 hypothetical protein QA584_17445 [Anaerocolumna sp. AGMB13025]